MVIIECTKAFVEEVARLKLSPPFRFGRVQSKAKKIDRVFVGICSEREMAMHLARIEVQIQQGGDATGERRIRGLS